jgi:hypothetical protein
MRSFPHLNDSTGLLYRIAAYMAAITLVVTAGMAGLVHLAGPSEKIESGPRLRMSPTLGIAAKAADHEISAARARNPVWIAPTTKYAYTAPPPRAAKVVAKAVVKPKKMKPRAQPEANEGTLAYGYAAQPRRSSSFQSPFFRDSVQ